MSLVRAKLGVKYYHRSANQAGEFQGRRSHHAFPCLPGEALGISSLESLPVLGDGLDGFA